ncbi:MAG: VWA domain-containing protein [Anaerolineae bacterium]|nr:VWA domain-containing protein [Anaerolineae bacterium]
MSRLMRCLYCGVLQDEPAGAKLCVRCGGELAYESGPPPGARPAYIQVQMELDQVMAPSERNIERHILITLKTPTQVPPEESVPTETGRTPLNFAAVLDVSGSMRGQKLTQAKEAIRQALHRMYDGDVFSLVTFGQEVHSILESTHLNEQWRRTVIGTVDEIQASGMTALCGGLEAGIKHAQQMQCETNLVLLLSDGQANVGETDIEKVGARGHKARQRGILVSTLGVGADYNEALMVEIATQGGGRFYHVTNANQIGAYMTGELGEVAALAARETTLALSLPKGAMLMPLSAAYPAQQHGDQATVTIGDIPCDTELEIPIRITLPAQPAGTKLSIKGSLTYKSPAGNVLKTPLNRVTVRFVEHPTFQLRDGVVAPVVERVLEQMKATSVLGVSRSMAKDHAEGARRAREELTTVQSYAALLGEERAEEETEGTQMLFKAMQAAPSMAKEAVFRAHATHRGTKSFDKT